MAKVPELGQELGTHHVLLAQQVKDATRLLDQLDVGFSGVPEHPKDAIFLHPNDQVFNNRCIGAIRCLLKHIIELLDAIATQSEGFRL